MSVITIRSCTGEKWYVPRKATQAWRRRKKEKKKTNKQENKQKTQQHLTRYLKTSAELLKSQKAVSFPFCLLFSSSSSSSSSSRVCLLSLLPSPLKLDESEQLYNVPSFYVSHLSSSSHLLYRSSALLMIVFWRRFRMLQTPMFLVDFRWSTSSGECMQFLHSFHFICTVESHFTLGLSLIHISEPTRPP